MVQKELTYALHGTQSLQERFCATLALTFYACDYTAWIDEAKNPKEAEVVVKALASAWSTSILCMPDKDLGIVARKRGVDAVSPSTGSSRALAESSRLQRLGGQTFISCPGHQPQQRRCRQCRRRTFREISHPKRRRSQSML